jgi:ketosteroid isomerase-like protein
VKEHDDPDRLDDTFVQSWLAAWNSHDLEEIMSFYRDDVTLISPTARQLLGDPSGEVKGKAALRAYFEKGLQAYPHLRFELLDVMWGVSNVVLCFVNQKGTRTAELMELDPARKITRVVASYSR